MGIVVTHERRGQMTKILYVATVVRKHIIEFHIPYLKMLKEMGWETSVAARNDYDDQEACNIPFCDEYFDVPFERNPLKPGNVKAYTQLKRIVDEGGYDIIHVHTPVGALLGRLAARKVRKRGTRVFYTAHGFHFYNGAPLLNWLVYYPVERLLAHWTDVLITINREDYERAKKFKASKVVYVPGVGIDVEKFAPVPGLRESKRAELGLAEGDFALLSVGELSVRKNHRVVVEAMGELKRRGCLGSLRYLVCGDGPLAGELADLTESLGVGGRVELLGYRDDVSEIMRACDAFAFPSRQEGLPVALMEAMASGLPCVCSPIRGNLDIVEDGVTGLVAESDPAAIADTLESLMVDIGMRERLGTAAMDAVKRYDLTDVEKKMLCVYGLETGWEGAALRLQRVRRGQLVRKELGIPLEARVILSVGEVNANKNHCAVIKALPMLDGDDVWYVVCGDGPLVGENMELARRLGVASRVAFAGYRNNIPDFHAAADVFAFPSKREGLPVALMEAMAAGLPCVCGRIRGNVDLLDAAGGSLFDPTDERDISRAVAAALDGGDAQWRKSLETVRAFDLEHAVETIRGLYAEGTPISAF